MEQKYEFRYFLVKSIYSKEGNYGRWRDRTADILGVNQTLVPAELSALITEETIYKPDENVKQGTELCREFFIINISRVEQPQWSCEVIDVS